MLPFGLGLLDQSRTYNSVCLTISYFFRPLRGFNIRSFQAIGYPSNGGIALSVFSRVFRFTLTFQVDKATRRKLRVLLISGNARHSNRCRIARIFPSRRSFILIVSSLSQLSFRVHRDRFVNVCNRNQNREHAKGVRRLLPKTTRCRSGGVSLSGATPIHKRATFPRVRLNVFPMENVQRLLVSAFKGPLLIRVVLAACNFRGVMCNFPTSGEGVEVLFLRPIVGLKNKRRPMPKGGIASVAFMFIGCTKVLPTVLRFYDRYILIRFRMPTRHASVRAGLRHSLNLIGSF